MLVAPNLRQAVTFALDECQVQGVVLLSISNADVIQEEAILSKQLERNPEYS